MNIWTLPALALVASLGAPLVAQDAHFGAAVNLAFPTGSFQSNGHYDSTLGVTSTDSFDTGVGVMFNASFPMDRRMAFRLEVGGEGFSGKNRAPGYGDLNLQQRMFTIGGQAQVFVGNGTALRYLGPYLVGGFSLDMERFDTSVGNSYYNSDSFNKTRIGGLVGAGYAWRPYGSMRYTLEGAFHRTLTGTGAGDPPAADFFRASFGIMF
jgi:hypothetical protein